MIWCARLCMTMSASRSSIFDRPASEASRLQGSIFDSGTTDTVVAEQAVQQGMGLFDRLGLALLIILGAFMLWRSIRLVIEIYLSKNLVYMQVTLPRSDSKLDKEQETKKDFKEQIGIMSVVYKSLHKLNSASFRYWISDFFLRHIKISMEMVYQEGQIRFFIVTYREFFDLVSQQINSVYPNAELREIEKKNYVQLRKPGNKIWTSGIRKDEDKFFPIKTYKYFEEDPLSNLTSNFGSLSRKDSAVFQVVLKPVGEGWNKKAKKVARRYSKGQYTRKSGGFSLDLASLGGLLAPIGWLVSTFFQNQAG